MVFPMSVSRRFATASSAKVLLRFSPTLSQHRYQDRAFRSMMILSTATSSSGKNAISTPNQKKQRFRFSSTNDSSHESSAATLSGKTRRRKKKATGGIKVQNEFGQPHLQENSSSIDSDNSSDFSSSLSNQKPIEYLLPTNRQPFQPKIPKKHKKKFPGVDNNSGQSHLNNDETEYILPTIDEYLEHASLSPWVPVPESVGRRMLQIANASANDVHYELGSGDGRVNFMAIDAPFQVKKSVGYEIDQELLKGANERRMRRFPIPNQLEFVQVDLLEEAEKFTQQTKESTDKDNQQIIKKRQIETKADISDATVVTMYFVEDALTKLKPFLHSQLENSNCRIVTCGYAISDWDPSWVEVIMGLPIYLYKMNDWSDAQRESEKILSSPNIMGGYVNDKSSSSSSQDSISQDERELLEKEIEQGNYEALSHEEMLKMQQEQDYLFNDEEEEEEIDWDEDYSQQENQDNPKNVVSNTDKAVTDKKTKPKHENIWKFNK